MPAQNTGHDVLTDEIQEVISYQPHWIVRRGNTLFFLILLGILCVCWVIRYPDVVQSRARLLAVNPPKQVVAREQGKLAKLLVAENEYVKAGQHLAYLESTASYDQVMKLNGLIDKVADSSGQIDLGFIADNGFPLLSKLGELQPAYQVFQNQWAVTVQTFKTGFFDKRRKTIQQDLKYLEQQKEHLQRQRKAQEEDRALQEKEYHAYEKLARDKVIAPLELNQMKSKLLSKEQGLEQIDLQAVNNQLSNQSKYKELLDIQKQMADQQQEFRSALLQLKSEMEKWIQQYVQVAAESGIVLFASALSVNQLISSGQTLFYIRPQQSVYYLELTVGQRGFGKIKEGQKVVVRIDGYPSEEFGSLTARINYISLIPSRTDSFVLKAALPNGLNTNYGKVLPFNNELSASADIITTDRRLLHRFMGRLREIWKR